MRESKRDLRALLDEAEFRASRNFTKIQRIEKILVKAEENKEMYYLTLEKIREVIAGN